ncbi:MAG: hypothetical protein DSY42_04555 [Aquifex sp.]|nr:MAG: hypothetical protein DSY42_04555 [Aquifex sp.]
MLADYFSFGFETEEDFKIIRKKKNRKPTARKILERLLEGFLIAVFSAIFLGVFISIVAFILMVGYESAKKLVEIFPKLFRFIGNIL